MASILIVDDHVLNREFLQALLSYDGHRILEAGDGVEGLKLARAERPDLIIADILMPHMNGHEFVSHIHTDHAIAGIPVIFYTATFQEREAGLMAVACGVRWVLPKPSDPEAILQTVREVLQRPATASVPPLLPALPSEEMGLSTMNRQLAEYLDELEASSGLLSKIALRDDTSKNNILEELASRLSQLLSSLQAVSLRLTALIDLGIELAGERDSARLIEAACRAVQNICMARYAVIGVLDEDGSRLSHFACSGLDEDSCVKSRSLPPIEGILHTLIQVQGSHRLRNAGGDPQGLGLPAGHPPVHSFLGVAIASRVRTYG